MYNLCKTSFLEIIVGHKVDFFDKKMAGCMIEDVFNVSKGIVSMSCLTI